MKISRTVVCMAAAALVGPRAVTAQNAGRAVVAGAVYDSLSAGPLAGADVILVRDGDTASVQREARTGSTGKYKFENVVSGEYLLRVRHPLLDSLGVGIPARRIQVSSAGAPVAPVNFAVPGGRSIHDAFCRGEPAADSSSLLLGYLIDAGTSRGVPDTKIGANWTAYAASGESPDSASDRALTRTDSTGWFALCGLAPASDVTVGWTTRDGKTRGVNVPTPRDRGVIRRTFYVPGATASDGVLMGTVVDSRSHARIPGASILVGLGRTAVSDQFGRFGLQRMEYGTQLVEAHATGYARAETSVNVLPGHMTTMELSLTPIDDARDGQPSGRKP